jgi:hypothetical protein
MIVSHYLPVLRVPGWLENDGRQVRRWRKLSQDLSLERTVDLVPPECRILLDLKEDLPWRRRELNARLVRLSNPERFIVSTHIWNDLAHFRANGFETWRTVRKPSELAHALSKPIDDRGVSIKHTLLNEESLVKLRNATSAVVVWTVNDMDVARRIAQLRVDGITTDSAEIMRLAALS